MPDVGGLEVLDVAIGLVVLFFLLSIALSAMNEGMSNILGWRAKTLEDALRNLVGDQPVKEGLRSWFGRLDPPAAATAEKSAATEGPPVDTPTEDVLTTLWDHWRMKALVRDPNSKLRRRARPSYLPPRAFSLALAETIAAGAPADGEAAKKSPWEQTDEVILKRVLAGANELPEGQLKDVVRKAAINANESLEGFRAQVERLFDDSMERASGWYKRKVQVVLLVLATVVVIGLNVDTVRVATSLWNDAPLRSAVATRASETGSPGDAAAALDAVEELRLPVGWGANAPDNVPSAIPGWVIAIAALNLGAPFWFDLLSRLARLRGSGLPERPRSLSDTVATVERERGPVGGRDAAVPPASPGTAPATDPDGAPGDPEATPPPGPS
jgi:hypothetical protein